MQSRVYSVDKVHVEGLVVIPENPPAVAVSAKGWVPTSGWSLPDLTPWIYIVPPTDGILDLDFVAVQPTGFVLQVFTPISVTKAFVVPSWVTGVRVHTSTNELEAKIGGKHKPTEALKSLDGLPVPWPFPWWAPWGKPKK
ncbi:hypothetical protein EN866_34930 [Mesorhizobium sp. M2D.F.Ca.ET.223.01.1.1]|uniref:hypothetical protein n=1 Tax=Mesorhizobium sp. M2D.F.Ca.ET.223.01.1.1 TaxID=2563940 RepID=UPI001092889B|nr:hypothetical protein [Mesorhizobium sp. M2D.F.Ca.ET.223.01.1.1]TGR82310.1 hypothetical protein EN866_34930 [Mesorhizobium sp. M2D.F.Ca.ET.223.01.1.1]TGT78410.1 hypothetical protein EN802_01835 [bacterium M00.F.Ca.ET.159.01.1.1]TGT89077.1 hypothetical protein EN800_01835 [bacterium M00.F.Ca.ET.157.01.1.1]